MHKKALVGVLTAGLATSILGVTPPAAQASGWNVTLDKCTKEYIPSKEFYSFVASATISAPAKTSYKAVITAGLESMDDQSDGGFDNEVGVSYVSPIDNNSGCKVVVTPKNGAPIVRTLGFTTVKPSKPTPKPTPKPHKPTPKPTPKPHKPTPTPKPHKPTPTPKPHKLTPTPKPHKLTPKPTHPANPVKPTPKPTHTTHPANPARPTNPTHKVTHKVNGSTAKSSQHTGVHKVSGKTAKSSKPTVIVKKQPRVSVIHKDKAVKTSINRNHSDAAFKAHHKPTVKKAHHKSPVVKHHNKSRLPHTGV